jgi:hypothetical protein
VHVWPNRYCVDHLRPIPAVSGQIFGQNILANVICPADYGGRDRFDI